MSESFDLFSPYVLPVMSAADLGAPALMNPDLPVQPPPLIHMGATHLPPPVPSPSSSSLDFASRVAEMTVSIPPLTPPMSASPSSGNASNQSGSDKRPDQSPGVPPTPELLLSGGPGSAPSPHPASAPLSSPAHSIVSRLSQPSPSSSPQITSLRPPNHLSQSSPIGSPQMSQRHANRLSQPSPSGSPQSQRPPNRLSQSSSSSSPQMSQRPANLDVGRPNSTPIDPARSRKLGSYSPTRTKAPPLTTSTTSVVTAASRTTSTVATTTTATSATTANATATQKVVEEEEDSEDVASRRGVFGWETIDGKNVPTIFRHKKPHVSVRMVEEKMLKSFPSSFPDKLKNAPPLHSFYITDAERRLLNEINVEHCNFEFGHAPFTSNDVVVRLEDFKKFYEQVKENCTTSQPGSHTAPGGWLQINNTVTPFVHRSTGRMVPLNVVRISAGLNVSPSLGSEECSEKEIDFMNKLCQSASVPFQFQTPTKLISVEIVVSFCKPVLSVLPMTNPFAHAKYLSPERLKAPQAPQAPPAPVRPSFPQPVNRAPAPQPRLRQPTPQRPPMRAAPPARMSAPRAMTRPAVRPQPRAAVLGRPPAPRQAQPSHGPRQSMSQYQRPQLQQQQQQMQRQQQQQRLQQQQQQQQQQRLQQQQRQQQLLQQQQQQQQQRRQQTMNNNTMSSAQIRQRLQQQQMNNARQQQQLQQQQQQQQLQQQRQHQLQMLRPRFPQRPATLRAQQSAPRIGQPPVRFQSPQSQVSVSPQRVAPQQRLSSPSRVMNSAPVPAQVPAQVPASPRLGPVPVQLRPVGGEVVDLTDSNPRPPSPDPGPCEYLTDNVKYSLKFMPCYGEVALTLDIAGYGEYCNIDELAKKYFVNLDCAELTYALRKVLKVPLLACSEQLKYDLEHNFDMKVTPYLLSLDQFKKHLPQLKYMFQCTQKVISAMDAMQLQQTPQKRSLPMPDDFNKRPRLDLASSDVICLD